MEKDVRTSQLTTPYLQAVAAGVLPKSEGSKLGGWLAMLGWHDGGHQTRGGRHDGGVRSEEGGLACSLVGVTGRDYCTYYCLSMACDRR